MKIRLKSFFFFFSFLFFFFFFFFFCIRKDVDGQPYGYLRCRLYILYSFHLNPQESGAYFTHLPVGQGFPAI